MIINEAHAETVATRTARWNRIAPTMAAVVTDLVVVSLVTVLATVGRMRLPFFDEVGDVDNLVAIVGVPIVLGWIIFIALHGAYSPHVMGAGTTEYKLVVRATMVAAGATGVVCYLAKFQFSRGFFFLLIILGTPALLLGRFVLRRVVYVLRRRGYLVHRVIVAGSAAQVDEVARVLDRERWLGYHVIGAVLPAAEAAECTPRGVPVLGSTARTAAIVTDSDCDIVLFAGGAVTSAQQMRRAAWELAETSVQIMLVPSLTDVAGDRVRVRPAAGLQLMELEGPRAQNATRVSKRDLRPRRGGRAARPRQPAAHRHGDRDQGARRRGRALPPAAGGTQRRPLRLLQVPLDGRWAPTACSTPWPPRTSTRRATSCSRPSTTPG